MSDLWQVLIGERNGRNTVLVYRGQEKADAVYDAWARDDVHFISVSDDYGTRIYVYRADVSIVTVQHLPEVAEAQSEMEAFRMRASVKHQEKIAADPVLREAAAKQRYAQMQQQAAQAPTNWPGIPRPQ
jgi:hypothetical protein